MTGYGTEADKQQSQDVGFNHHLVKPANFSNLTDQPKVNWDHRMAELEIKRDAARARLVEIGHASNQAWAEVKKGAQAAWSELDKALHEAASEF